MYFLSTFVVFIPYDFRALTLVGPTPENPVPVPLAVQHLDNWLLCNREFYVYRGILPLNCSSQTTFISHHLLSTVLKVLFKMRARLSWIQYEEKSRFSHRFLWLIPCKIIIKEVISEVQIFQNKSTPVMAFFIHSPRGVSW